MIGILLALALLALYGAAIIAVFRVPFRAFGVLVGGMAVHNILLMALLRLDTPGIVIRVLQSWKEGILILLGVLVASRAWREFRARRLPRLALMDWVAGAFALLLVVYVAMPASLLHNGATYTQRVVEFRQAVAMGNDGLRIQFSFVQEPLHRLPGAEHVAPDDAQDPPSG